MSGATMERRHLLAGHDRESLTDMAEAIADFMACCPTNDVAETSHQLSAMAISLLLDLARNLDCSQDSKGSMRRGLST